ncbi:MAG: hypothetical protein IPK82_17195 [Polyangiaceae bacterium]|nr:hypothetical protein [Polyangiaceae bacterium]
MATDSLSQLQVVVGASEGATQWAVDTVQGTAMTAVRVAAGSSLCVMGMGCPTDPIILEHFTGNVEADVVLQVVPGGSTFKHLIRAKHAVDNNEPYRVGKEMAAPTLDLGVLVIGMAAGPMLEAGAAAPVLESGAALPSLEVAGATNKGLQLAAFSESTIDSAVASVAAPASPQISVGARALMKKQGHAAAGGYASAFDGLAATTENAQLVVRNILTNPTKTIYGKATYDVYDAAGRGARFALHGSFKGFLELGKATR